MLLNTLLSRAPQPLPSCSPSRIIATSPPCAPARCRSSPTSSSRRSAPFFAAAIATLAAEDQRLSQIQIHAVHLLRALRIGSATSPILLTTARKRASLILFQGESLIQLLFATETFAMGKCPRTVVFTSPAQALPTAHAGKPFGFDFHTRNPIKLVDPVQTDCFCNSSV